MRELVFTEMAKAALENICEFVESKNTESSGDRYSDKFSSFLEQYLPLTNLKFPLCTNKELAALYFSCIVFQNKWVVAFRYNDERITIHRIILGSKLK